MRERKGMKRLKSGLSLTLAALLLAVNMGSAVFAGNRKENVKRYLSVMEKYATY